MTKGISYNDYLQIPKLLSAQSPESTKAGRPAHDEMLFITVHQVYELWFKQVLHELDSIRSHFLKAELKDEALGPCVARLERITRIQSLMMHQVGLLETMTPMDFLDFRDLLYPASGFQSFQFRLVENKLGLNPKTRLLYDKESYVKRLDPAYREEVERSEKEESLFILVERWLERTPFLQTKNFSFWQEYKNTVEAMLSDDRAQIEKNPFLNEEGRKSQLEQFEKTKKSFEVIFDEAKLQTAQSEGSWRLSHKATLATLFIYLYRDQPALQLPFKLLSLLTDIDENFTAWRSRHAQMALRMIGTKIGTGGSSGAEYLSKAAASHRIFFDLTRLATFLIPRTRLPELPPRLKEQLSFHYQMQKS